MRKIRVYLPCSGEFIDERKVKVENIEENIFGKDILTFKCPKCGETHSREQETRMTTLLERMIAASRKAQEQDKRLSQQPQKNRYNENGFVDLSFVRHSSIHDVADEIDKLNEALRIAYNAMSNHMWDARLPYVKSGDYARDIEIIGRVLSRPR